MNIREVEELTGLVRANIRYYEDEGFFTPQRERNGYRNYSEEDVEVLKRIKLLRMLEIPIEEIRKVQSDEILMRTVLEKSIHRSEQRKKELDSSQKICRRMAEDRVTWTTLDADRYLNHFEKADEKERSSELSAQDFSVYEPHNIRRFAARWLDLQIYGLFIYGIYYLVISPGIHLTSPKNWIIALFAYVMMILMEPLCLHFLGTTLGKWILGIRVRHLVGRRLTLEEARRRTWSVIWWGCGFNLPIFSLIRLGKSAFDNSDGTGLPWDNGGEYELDVEKMTEIKQRIFRIGGWILATCLLVGGQLYLLTNAKYPLHRGKLTKAELAENINAYLDEAVLYWQWNLDDELNWVEDTTLGNKILLGDSGKFRPQLQVVEKDGYVTQLFFDQTITMGGVFRGHDEFIRVLMLAFGGAQPQVNFLNRNLKDMFDLIPENPNEKFSATIAGIDFYYELVNYSYKYIEGQGFYANGKEFKLTVYFSMKLAE